MLGALLGGLTEGLGGGILSAVGQSSANAANREMANEQMDFQERMSNTAYQRATQDMQKAGINPMLAYMQGGASSGAGAMSTEGNVGGAFSEGASAQAARKLQNEQAEQAEQTTEKIKAEKENVQADTAIKPEMLKVAKINAAASALQSQKAGVSTLYSTPKQMILDFIGSFGGDNSAKSKNMKNSPPPTGAKKDY